MPHTFDAPLWRTPPPNRWYFLTVPQVLSDEIDERTRGLQGGFGSVKVEVTIGATTWLTSIFPSKEAAAYILPVKQSVRSAEDLVEGTRARVRLRLVGLE